MKKIYFSVVFMFIVGIVIVFMRYPKGEVAFSKISDFYGEWSVVDTQKFGGTLISDEEFKRLMENPLIIEKDHMIVFGVEITSPTYKYQRIDNKIVQGVIQDKTTSSFYGFYPDRKFIHQFRIMRGSETEGVFEVLSKEKLLFMVAGRIVVAERKKQGA